MNEESFVFVSFWVKAGLYEQGPFQFPKPLKEVQLLFLKYPVYTWLGIEQLLATPSGSMHFGDVLETNDRPRDPKQPGLED